MHGIGAWVVHGILAGPAGPCMVHGVWHRCMVVHTALCMGGVPDGGWVKECVYTFCGQLSCTASSPVFLTCGYSVYFINHDLI